MVDGTERLAGLLKRITQGEEHALNELISVAGSKLLNIAHAHIPILGLAEDAVQETYTVIWFKAHTYQPLLGSPMAWMAGILKKNIKKQYRNSKVYKNTPFNENLADAWTAHDYIHEDYSKILSPKEIYVIKLKNYGARYKEIAQINNWTVDKVTNLARTAKTKIREYLEKYN